MFTGCEAVCTRVRLRGVEQRGGCEAVCTRVRLRGVEQRHCHRECIRRGGGGGGGSFRLSCTVSSEPPYGVSSKTPSGKGFR